MKSFELTVSRTATCYQLGEFSTETETVWFVCHGYGQRADYFLQNFQVLDNGKNVVIAPEGLSKFYRQGASGHVGASWMTKYQRETEITDYVNYLNQVFESVKFNFTESAHINLLGFSQGGATVCRWLTGSTFPFSRLILWSAAFPEDMDFDFSIERLKNVNIVMVNGSEDEMIPKAMPATQFEILRSYGLTPQQVTFNGGHEFNDDILIQIEQGII